MPLSGILSGLATAITSVGQKVYSIAESIIGGIVSFIKMIIDHVYTWMQGFWTMARDDPFKFIWFLGNLYILIGG
jgi:phage-related protein